jgi:hypothetical protein
MTWGYHAEMATAPLVAAIFALASVLGTGVFLGLRALGTWRTFRRFTRAASEAVEGVTRTAAEAEKHATAAAAGAEQLTAASRRLQEAVAQLSLLQAAAGEFKATLARVRGVVPTK